MFIRFVKPLWDSLQKESEKTGKSIPSIVQEIVAKHFCIEE